MTFDNRRFAVFNVLAKSSLFAACLALLLLASCQSEVRKTDGMAFKNIPPEKIQPEAEPELTAAQYVSAGDRLAESGSPDAAFIDYLRAEKLAPDTPGPHLKLGLLYIARKMYPEAEQKIAAALKLAPEDPQANEAMGKVYLATGRLDGAKALYEKALLKDKDSWKAFNALGFIADRQGRFAEAAGYYAKALAASPDNAVVLNNMGISSLLSGDSASAEKYLQLAQEKVGTGKPGLISNNIGLVYAKKGDYKAALSYFKDADGLAAAYNNLGCVYMSQGQYAQAYTAFEQAIKASPKYYGKAAENLEKAKEAAGKP